MDGEVAESDADTRTRILEAGIDTLARFGSTKTSVQNVAEAAGLSRATLYRYFRDRSELLRAIRHHERESFSATVLERVRAVRTLRDAVAIMAEVAAYRALRYPAPAHAGDGDPALVILTRPSAALVHALIGPHIEYAAATDQLMAGGSAAQAVEWISVCLSTVYWLRDSGSVKLDDPAAIGAYYADRICGGIVARGEAPKTV